MITYSFLITSLIMVLIPGTGVIYTISTGITQGKRDSIISAIGCTLGILPHLTASILMTALILRMGNMMFTIIKLLGAGYLIYLGINMIRAKEDTFSQNQKKHDRASTIIRDAILINLLNPKLTIFFFAFLPQYIEVNDQMYVWKSIVLGGIFMLLTLLVFCLYGMMGAAVSQLFIKSPQYIRRITQGFGVVFIIFALRLAFSSI